MTTGTERRLTGKKAIVTGASRGIGRRVAIALAQQGADLLLVARDETRLRTVSDEIAAAGRRGEILAADLRQEDAAVALEKAAADLEGCDILVNCAGATKGGLWPQQPEEEWLDGFALKFFGTVRAARALWPRLVASRGTVINIVGGFARAPSADFMVGGAVNAALANFSKALSMQGLRDDVNVNWIHPGLVETERYEEISARRAAQAGISIDDVKQRQIDADGIRRLGRPEDVANAVVFLCLPEARHINGSALTIDGGGGKAIF